MRSIKNIILFGLLVVLGACSALKDKQAFFDLVKDKSVYTTNNELIGTFSSDGKIFTEILDSKKNRYSF